MEIFSRKTCIEALLVTNGYVTEASPWIVHNDRLKIGDNLWRNSQTLPVKLRELSEGNGHRMQ